MIEKLPVDKIAPRFAKLIIGSRLWLTKYSMTHLESGREFIGQEMILPTAEESLGLNIRFGMDRIIYPPSMVQSKRVYGQEAQIIAESGYPIPEGSVLTLREATDQIERAREEHPEWLTDVKGFGN